MEFNPPYAANPSSAQTRVWGCFSLSALLTLGPVLPFWSWFDPGASCCRLVPAVQHQPCLGVSNTLMLFGGLNSHQSLQ